MCSEYNIQKCRQHSTLRNIGCSRSRSWGWLGAVAHGCFPAAGECGTAYHQLGKRSRFKIWSLLLLSYSAGSHSLHLVSFGLGYFWLCTIHCPWKLFVRMCVGQDNIQLCSCEVSESPKSFFLIRNLGPEVRQSKFWSSSPTRAVSWGNLPDPFRPSSPHREKRELHLPLGSQGIL